jgi:hypothetical protein
MLICYSFWSFGIFSRFGMFGPRKIWQPCSKIQTFALAQENFNFRIDLSTSALTKVTSLGEFSPVDRFLPSDNSMKFT